MKNYLSLSIAIIAFANSVVAQIKPPTLPNTKPKLNNTSVNQIQINNAVNATATAGLVRYRITINGFTVNRPTADHILEVDGKGDEVYFYGYSKKFDVNGKVIEEKRARQSLIMGDVNNEFWRQGERIKAGSKAGEQGGLQQGDRFPTNEPWKQYNKPNTRTLPFIVSEGTMQKGETIVTIPTIWEYDGTTEFEQGLNAFASDATKVTIIAGAATFSTLVAGPVAGVATIGMSLGADLVINAKQSSSAMNEVNNNSIFAKMENPNSDFNIYVQKTVFGDAKDRPIGMIDNGGSYTFNPMAMKIDYDNMIRYSNLNFGFGKGVLPLRIMESPQLEGDYTLYIQIEAATNAKPLEKDNLFSPDENITAKANYAIRNAYDNRILVSNEDGNIRLGEVTEAYDGWSFSKIANTSNQFYIQDGVYNKVLDVYAHSTENGGSVILFNPINASNQRWKIIPYGDGTFSIIANESGKALSWDFKTNKLIQYENRYNADQRWKIE